MIDLAGVVHIIVWILVAAIIFGLLFYLIQVVGRLFPGEPGQLFIKVANVVLLVLAILVIIGFVLSFATGQPLFKTGQL